ncbi:MAG TPA: DUF6622 family protein [Telluria sp.]|nr:DUF6622 family protein [Telluria sp.]
MLILILTHTPIYVWAILALLVYRGIAATREREIGIRKLFIIPLIMLALSLQGIASKFGTGFLPLAAWAAGAAALTLTIWKFGRPRIAAAAEAGKVRVQGSWAPLAMMMAIFFAKYAVAVTLAVHPQAAQSALLTASVCALFGLFNGYFLGRLANDMTAWQSLRTPRGASVAAVA